MSEQQCTCHCGGSMFYRHLHAESCALSRDGAEAPVSVEQALRAENQRLKEALQGMVKLVDDGLLVRNIANDHIAGWGIRALPIVQALQQANEALQPERGRND